VSKANNREKKIVCQIINAMFFFMLMLQFESYALTGILDFCYAGHKNTAGILSEESDDQQAVQILSCWLS
jgi:hypothetical protein